MLQEDSNGETTFEIIERKTEELSVSEPVNTMPSSAPFFPPPPSGGNLLSNVRPPTALPNFIPTTMIPTPTVASLSGPMPLPPNLTQIPPTQNILVPQPIHTVPQPIQSAPQPMQSAPQPIQSVSQPTTALNIESLSEPYYPTQFSAAIPPNKGMQYSAPPHEIPLQSSDDSGGFLGWMKGAVASGGILSKVAEKAKNSVDSMITTLDPQMKEYIYSGGDVNVLVASGQEVKQSAIREAFQAVFGKATIHGISVQSTSIAAQPVGFAAGMKAADERIQQVFKESNLQPVPVVAVENFLLEVSEDQWYDLGVLVLNDPLRQINLQTFTQMTPVPTAVVVLAQEDTPADYPQKWSGLSVTIGSLMAKNLGVSYTEWHEAVTGVTRREMILLAAKSLASLYKNSIN